MIKALAQYYKSIAVRKNLRCPLIVTEETRTLTITSKEVNEMSLSSLSEESISSSDWEVWNESDWLSEMSDDDPD